MKSVRDLDPVNRREEGSRQGSSPFRGGPIEIEALAERVYRLLLEDMRLARSRGAILRKPRER